MNDRQQDIQGLLLQKGRLTVEELTSHFGVTGMTIRRDLQSMEEAGLLTRTHGGCVLRGRTVQEQPFRDKEFLHRGAKEAIARKVVAELAGTRSLYLDTGTTCAVIAGLLAGHAQDLRVFTNNIPAAMALFGVDGIEVVMLGGSLGRRSPDLTGPMATEQLARVRFDVAVVGADAVDLQAGEWYAAELATAAVSLAAQTRAERVLACVDHSKIGRSAVAVAGRLDDRVTLFTDSALSPADRRALRTYGTKIVIPSKRN